MANDRGGVIVLGVEDKDGMAFAVPGVNLSEGEALRMKQSAAELSAPHVAWWDPLPVERTRGEGFYLLVVPPSANRPHAVRVGPGLRYPRRDGAHTRYLSESEVADMYRDRFRGAGAQVRRLGEMGLEVFGAVETSVDIPWVLVMLVPNSAGSMRLDLTSLREFRAFTDQHVGPQAAFWQSGVELGVGQRRVVARPSRRSPHDRPQSGYAELYTDGSGAAADSLRWPREPLGTEPLIVDNVLILTTVAALDLLGRHAVNNTGAWGEAAAEVRVRCPTATFLASATQADRFGSFGLPDAPLKRSGDVQSQHTISLDDLTGPTQRLVAVAALMLTDIWQAFGFPEVQQLALDGAIRIRHFAPLYQERLRQWAADRDVPVSDEFRPQD
jgi:hypothetical protein